MATLFIVDREPTADMTQMGTYPAAVYVLADTWDGAYTKFRAHRPEEQIVGISSLAGRGRGRGNDIEVIV